MGDGDMTYELYCTNREISEDISTTTRFDVTTLAGTITHQTTLNGQPGKLTVTLQRDPNEKLRVACGNMLEFIVDGAGIFKGYVFTMDGEETGTYKILAYDQMRYLRNKEIYITSEMTASEIFEQICADNLQISQWEVVTPTSHVAPAYFHENKMLYEIIKYGIDQAIIHENDYYFVKDNFGTLQFTSLSKELTNLMIGDGSLLTGYTYEISIDKDTYNVIKGYVADEKKGSFSTWITKPVASQALWGKLQLLDKAPEGLNEAQLADRAEQLLKLHNRETKTLKLNIVGLAGRVTDIPKLIAGSGFNFQLERLGINQNMWVTSAVHNYEKDYHTASLEVFV